MDRRWQCKDIPDLRVLQAAQAFAGLPSWDRRRTGDLVVEWTGAPVKVVEAKILRMVRRGLLVYGNTLWASYLSDLGEVTLREAGEEPPPLQPGRRRPGLWVSLQRQVGRALFNLSPTGRAVRRLRQLMIAEIATNLEAGVINGGAEGGGGWAAL